MEGAADGKLEKDPRRIRKMFDDISPTYDVLNHILSMSVDVGWRKRALEEMRLSAEDRVLDVASGTGDMALLANALYGCSVVGLDLSGSMLRVAARKWGKGTNADRFAAIEGDALHLPFQDGTFDKAMVAFGIRNMTDMPQFLSEVNRVLGPEGTLAVLEFSVPRYPVVRQLYLAYLIKALPFIGGLQSGNRSAYQYLSESIRRFPSPGSIEGLFREGSFDIVRSIPLSMGISHLYVVRKRKP